MRTHDNGCSFTVTYNESDTDTFAESWPGSTVTGHGSFSFENSGDILDASGSALDNDGPDWLAFSHDCQNYGADHIILIRLRGYSRQPGIRFADRTTNKVKRKELRR